MMNFQREKLKNCLTWRIDDIRYKIVKVVVIWTWPASSSAIAPRKISCPGITSKIITFAARFWGFWFPQNKKQGWTHPVPNSVGSSPRAWLRWRYVEIRDEKTATKLPPTPFITGENTATPLFEAKARSRMNPPPELKNFIILNLKIV